MCHEGRIGATSLSRLNAGRAQCEVSGRLSDDEISDCLCAPPLWERGYS